MLKYHSILFLFLLFLLSPSLVAQQDISKLRWRQVVYSQPDEWYGSEEAIRIAEDRKSVV